MKQIFIPLLFWFTLNQSPMDCLIIASTSFCFQMDYCNNYSVTLCHQKHFHFGPFSRIWEFKATLRRDYCKEPLV